VKLLTPTSGGMHVRAVESSITKDEDFLHLATRQAQTGGLIWVRLGNCRTRNLLAEFERLWPRIQASLEAGDRVIEIR